MTRIASIATYPVSVPRTEPVWTAQEESRAWSVILTEIKTDDGLTGYGLIHGAPMQRICEWVGRFGEIVAGMDALAHEAVWDRLFALTCPRPGAIAAEVGGRGNVPPPTPRGERAQVMAAIAGIDIALWDLKGKAAGLPVYRLLGGANRPLFTYATGGYYRRGADDADYGRELAQFLDLGYRAVKLKTGAGSPEAEQFEVVGREHRQMVHRAERVMAARRQRETERSKDLRRLVHAVADVDHDMVEKRRRQRHLLLLLLNLQQSGGSGDTPCDRPRAGLMDFAGDAA